MMMMMNHDDHDDHDDDPKATKQGVLALSLDKRTGGLHWTEIYPNGFADL